MKRREIYNEIDKVCKEKEEKGEPYIKQLDIGRWEIFDGKDKIITGDGGILEYRKALMDAVQNEIKKIKNDLRGSDKGLD